MKKEYKIVLKEVLRHYKILIDTIKELKKIKTFPPLRKRYQRVERKVANFELA